MKVEESLNVTFNKSPPPTNLSPLVDDDVGEEEAIERNVRVDNNNNIEDESIEVDEVINIKESKSHLFEQAIGLESFLTLDEPICPRFVTDIYNSFELKRDEDEYPYIEFKLGSFTFELTTTQLSRIFKQLPTLGLTFYTNDWSLTSLNDHSNNRFFTPNPDLVKKTITIPRITQSQLQRDPNKLFQKDLRPELKGWELFIRDNVLCILGNRDHVNACTTYMLYYLSIKKTFDLTTMIILLMNDVKKNSDGHIPFVMILTKLYKYLLQTNPQSIVLLDSFTYHQLVMNPLDIPRKTIKNKGKIVAPSSSSSSSSSNEDEEPSLLILTSRNVGWFWPVFGLPWIDRSTKFEIRLWYSEEHHIERTPSPPLRKKSLSPPNAPSKSTSSRSTYQTTSSSPSESPTLWKS
ncbi:hypothetical protein Tco_0924695 [Tanacetum coccineum]|uniref:Uncharacterized protein n=1 Tax=Tanacetum coccineum TaxID=301880 RepID=A0ABQ5D7S2_9ASTR